MYNINENIMEAGVLLDEYNNNLMSNEHIRFLLRNVNQNAQNETIDLDKSNEQLSNLIRSNSELYLGAPRRAIIGWLNKVYFCSVASKLPIEFWWEMNTRLTKLTTVSLILERENLKSFGVEKLSEMDIPQCLVHVTDSLKINRKLFAQLAELQRKKYNDNINVLKYYVEY